MCLNTDESDYATTCSRDQLGVSLAELAAGQTAGSSAAVRRALHDLSLIGADNTHYSIQKRAQRVALASEASPQSPSDLAIARPSPELDCPSKKLEDEEASLDMPEEKDEAPRPDPEQERRPESMPMTSCIGRIGRPMFKLINRPWKVRSCVLSQSLQATDQALDQQMYPIGVLFGIGFDTASEM